MRERDIELRLAREVKKVGGLAYKLVTPGHRGAPDRLCIFPGGVIHFVELKNTGRKATPQQQLFIDRLVEKGCNARVIDSYEGVDAFIEEVTDANK